METLALPPPDTPEHIRELQLVRRILNTVFKWKWLIVVCFAAVVVPFGIFTWLKPPQYQVTSKLLLKTSPMQVAVSPVDSQQRTVNWPLTPQVLNSEIQILKSLDVLEGAARKSGYPLTEGSGSGLAQRLQSLQARISVTPVPDSNVIEVSFQDPEPRRAARFLNTLVDLYMAKHASVQGSGSDTAGFFERQAHIAQATLGKARSTLQNFEQNDRIIDVEQETTQNLQQLFRLQLDLKNLEAEVSGTERAVNALKAHMKDLPDEVTAQTTMSVNPEVNVILSKLAHLGTERNQLLQNFWPHSRFVLEKEKEIAGLRRTLEAVQRDMVGERIIAVSKTKETLKHELITKQADLDSLKAKKAAVIRELAPYHARLAVLKNKSFEVERLRKEFEEARNTYQLYTKKVEEARISGAMNEDKIVNVGIIQAASDTAPPVGQGLKIALALGVGAGLALGIGIAFALEFFNSTIKNEDDIERFLQVPVLATIRRF